MTTILEAEFGSDEEDSDYVLSETSSDEEDEKSARKQKREEKRRKEREKLLAKVNGMFDDMLKASDVSYRHPDTHDKDDFMLQFQKRTPPSPKIHTVRDFESYMDKSSSRVFKENLQLDIRNFKTECHETPNVEKLEMIKNAVAVRDADPASVRTTYKFAGTTYEYVHSFLITLRVMDKVSKKSRKYANYLKKKEKELGGNFSFLDDLYSKLGPAPTISAVSKSELDWTKFKDDHNLESSLKRNYHHLKEQAFLERATWNEYERQLRARRQQ